MMDRKDEKKGVGNVLSRLSYVTMIISNINKTMEKNKWMLKCHCAVRAIPGHHTAYLVCLWTVYDVYECVSINLLPSIDISDCKFVYSFSFVHCLCRTPYAVLHPQHQLSGHSCAQTSIGIFTISILITA